MTSIKRILVSQPSPIVGKNPFSDIAAKHNVEVDFCPLVKIQQVDFKEFRSQRIEILDHSAIIFTSRTAIDHFFGIAEQARITIPESMKYFCISEAVALYLQKYIVYRKRKIFFGEATFDQLVECLSKHKDLKYLFPLNDQFKPELLTKLTKSGIKHNKVILSHTVPADLEGVDLNGYDMVALYSQAEVRAFAEKYTSKGCKVATFGLSTAKAALEANLSVDLGVPAPGIPSIATGIDKYLSAIAGQENVESFAITSIPSEPKKPSKPSSARACAKL